MDTHRCVGKKPCQKPGRRGQNHAVEQLWMLFGPQTPNSAIISTDLFSAFHSASKGKNRIALAGLVVTIA